MLYFTTILHGNKFARNVSQTAILRLGVQGRIEKGEDKGKKISVTKREVHNDETSSLRN